MRIGVFDSGIGGQAVAISLQAILPEAEIISVADQANMPYGSRPPDEIIRLTKSAIQPLITQKCDVIVIACNTATTVAISELRLTYPSTNFIGIEPMIRPAAQITVTKRIAVCATPRTLQSQRYRQLKQLWAQNIDIVEPDCRHWADLIEHGRSNDIDLESTFGPLVASGIDVIVLGCTHYHWLKQRIDDLVGPNVVVLEPSMAIARRIQDITKTTVG